MERTYHSLLRRWRSFVEKIVQTELRLHSSPHIKKKDVLIVKTDNLGDFIVFSPYIALYLDLYQGREVFFLINGACAEYARRIGVRSANIIPFHGKKFAYNPFYRRKILLRLKKSAFDIAIQPSFSRTPLGDFLVKASEATKRIGYSGNCDNLAADQKSVQDKWYTKLIPNNTLLTSEVEINAYFLSQLGKMTLPRTPHIDITAEETSGAEEILKREGYDGKTRYALIHPGANSAYRAWPIEKFKEIIDFITREKGLYCVVSGVSSEKKLSEALFEASAEDGDKKIINMIGKTSFTELAAIAKGARFYLGNDTATVHIAAAVGTPTLCIQGGGNFRRFFPYGDARKNKIIYDHSMTCKNDNWNCRRQAPKGRPSPCIEHISSSQVKEEIDTLLRE